MGYVDPQQNMRTYLQTMNEQTRRFSTEYESMFNAVNADMRATISSNLTKLETDRLAKSVGQEAYYEAKRKAASKLKGGYSKNRNQFLDEIGKKNWEANSLPQFDRTRLQNQYLEVPNLIAQLQGAYVGYKKQYDEAIAVKDTTPNSWNPNTSLATMGFIDDDANHKYSVDDDGVLYVDYDYLGKHYHMSAQEIIDASVNGDWGIQTFGDPKAYRTQIHKDKFKNDGVAEKYTEVVDKTNPRYQTNEMVYDNANDEYYANIKDPDLYKGVLAVNSEMRRNWPIIVNDAYDIINDPNANPAQKKQMEELLGPILGGKEKFLGDDPTTTNVDESLDDINLTDIQYDQQGPVPPDPNNPNRTIQVNSNSRWVQFYSNQGEAGVWDPNNDDQNALATAWFGMYDNKSGIVTDSRITKIVKTAPTKSNPGGGGGNSTADLDEFNLTAKAWLKNQTDPNTGNNVVKNRLALLQNTPDDAAEEKVIQLQLAENEIKVEDYLNNPTQGLNSLGLPAKANSIYKMADDGQIYEQSIKNGKVKEYKKAQQDLVKALKSNDQTKIDEYKAIIADLETGVDYIGVTLGGTDIKSSLANLTTMFNTRQTKAYNNSQNSANNPLNLGNP